MKFSSSNLFKNINELQIKGLYKCLNAKEVKFAPNKEICSFNSSSNVLGIILSGKAYVKKIDRNGDISILETLQKNGVFSDVFSYTATDANYISVYSNEPTTVLFLDLGCVFKRCERACEHHSTFVYNLMMHVVDKSKTLYRRIEILSNKSIRDKILSYLSLLANQNESNKFTIPMSYTSLAQYLCVDRSAMMREFKKLNDLNIISTKKREVLILSTEYI